jgi:uncharacterized protein YecE (DUF72 family)
MYDKMSTIGRLYIGTSGWIYKDWHGIFYPKDLSSKKKLEYFSQHFKTAEVNYSFYRLPNITTYENWYSQTPKDFIFALKASRFITHVKRLKGVKSSWKKFLKNASNLKEKLGPVLFQFPSNFKFNSENVKRLEDIIEYISSPKLSVAFEFRHESWCNDDAYEMLRKYNGAWVISDSSRYPKAEVITAGFVYLRMHGPGSLFSSKYTSKELRILAKKVKGWSRKGLDVYIYFNNDFKGYAVQNAEELIGLLGKSKTN